MHSPLHTVVSTTLASGANTVRLVVTVLSQPAVFCMVEI